MSPHFIFSFVPFAACRFYEVVRISISVRSGQERPSLAPVSLSVAVLDHLFCDERNRSSAGVELMDGFQHPQAKALAGALSHAAATALLSVSQSCLPAALIVGELLKVTAKS